MLVKTLKFDDDVVAVIRAMEWSEDGKLGKITAGQLDRKLYERLNKALTAMGGKWNRKAGGHVFKTDPRPQVEGLLNDGSLVVQRDGFFETPLAVVERMLELVPFSPEDTVLEPSAGLGAIAKVLRGRGVKIGNLKLIEKNEQRAEELRRQLFYVECCDFLEYNVGGWTRIYMNPPFEEGQDMEHVRHAYNLLDPFGSLVSVMSEGTFFRQDRKTNGFRDWLYHYGGRAIMLPDNSFRDSGTGVNTRLIVMSR